VSEPGRREGADGARDGESGARIAQNAFYLVVGQATTTALGIVFTAVLGRSLGAADFGIYYLITTMSAFAYVFVEWGQPVVVIRQLAREPQRSGDLLGTALALRAAFAIVVTVPAALVAWALGYGTHTIWLSAFLIPASLPLFLAQGYGMVFRAHDRMGRDATVSVCNKVVLLGVALPALALGAAIPGVILGQAVAGLAALGIAARLYRRLGAPPLRVSSEALRELLAAGAPILAMTVAVSVQPYLDVILLSKLTPTAAVGWFGAARSILVTLMAPALILGAAAFPRIARASADRTALREVLRSALRPMLWLGALAGTGTYLFAGTAIGLVYGSSEFDPAVSILRVFAPGFFLLFIDILLVHVIFASGRGTGMAIAKIGSVGVGTALDLLLIPFFQERFGNGGLGVVVAFALSEIVVFAGAMIALRRGTLEPAMALDVVRSLAAAGMTILLFGVIPPLSPWVGIPLCVVAFTLATLALRLVRWSDLSLLRVLVRRPSLV
jgi:O-antigen/teichoic acid export membrane protein